MKDFIIYDIEVLGGNFFCCTFLNIKTNKTEICYVLDKEEYNTNIIYEYIKNTTLIGFNNVSYDDILMNYIFYNKEINTREIQALSNTIIGQQRTGIPLWKNEDVNFYMNKYVDSLDLMKILAFDKMKVGLKQCAVNLRHPLIQDLPFSHERSVLRQDLDLILSYNLNDVNITKTLLNKLRPDLNLRFKVSKDYNVNVKNASRTYIAKEIFNKYYADYTGLRFNDFKDLRTGRYRIQLKDCILPEIHYKTDIMNKMLDYFKSQTIISIDNAIDYLVLYKNKGYQMGFGGLHSVDRAGVFQSTDSMYMIDADVSSYYPNLVVEYKIKPQHCRDEFFTILKDLIDRRLTAKCNKDEITADTLKITVNSVFGLFNFENYWLYDPKAALMTTINGQLFLLMLIESLEESGFEVISANTDGITTYVPKERYDEYKKICKDWSDSTKFNLEYKKYLKYARRDINNYTVLQEDGDIKYKGIFSEKQLLEKGYNTTVIPKALNNYFFHNISIQDTINNSTDIFDFCLSEKSGNQFKMELHYLKGIEKKIKPLQKTNRYFIANKGGTFLKRKEDYSLHNMQVGWQVYILNDFIKDKESEYISNVDKRYYISECNKILETIEDKQLTLW
jgi:hypothetical protein